MVVPLKTGCFAYQDGNIATVAMMRMTYLHTLYICHVKSAASETLPSCSYKNDINGASHIKNYRVYLHLTLEG